MSVRPRVLAIFTVLALGGAELALWLLTRSPSRRPVERVQLSGRVIFVRAGPGVVMVGGETGIAANPRLVILSLGGGQPRILVSGGDIGHPSVSPDGSRVAFPWARALEAGPPVPSLYTVRTDGGGLTRLTICRPPECRGDADPSWSPDGTRIAFLRSSGSGQRLFLLEVSSGRAHPINLPELIPFGGASWSPDGHRLAFSAYSAGTSSVPEIDVVRTDGTDLRRLTSCRLPCRGGYADPSWSPDGTRIVAVRGYGGRGSLYLMSADGGGLRRLTGPGTGGVVDQEPAWSPAGEWVVFARGGDFGGDLYAIHSDGTDLQPLTSGPELDEGPVWTANGAS